MINHHAVFPPSTSANQSATLHAWAAAPINRALGKTGINVATRIMALIVAAIGVKNQLPGLLG